MNDEDRYRSRQTVRRSRIGRFFVDPTFSGYENAVGECHSCGAQLTVNRATDLDDTYPSARMKFKCFSCGRTLQLGGDIANHPVDQIAYDAYGPLLRREYMQSMLMVAQSLEWALAMCVHHVVLGRLRRPKRLRPESPLVRLHNELEEQLDHLTLGGLRKVVIGLAESGIAPRSATEAGEAIAMLRKLRGAKFKPIDGAKIENAKLREAIEDLIAAESFVQLRNAIAHHGARPTQTVAEHYYANVPALATRLLRAFGVMRGQLVMAPTGPRRRRTTPQSRSTTANRDRRAVEKI